MNLDLSLSPSFPGQQLCEYAGQVYSDRCIGTRSHYDLKAHGLWLKVDIYDASGDNPLGEHWITSPPQCWAETAFYAALPDRLRPFFLPPLVTGTAVAHGLNYAWAIYERVECKRIEQAAWEKATTIYREALGVVTGSHFAGFPPDWFQDQATELPNGEPLILDYGFAFTS